jgi:subtilisin family serine protease
MATSRKSRKSTATSSSAPTASMTAEGILDTSRLPTGPTGRYLVVLRDIGQEALTNSLRNVAGLKAVSSAEWEGAEVTSEDIGKADALVFEHIGVAVVSADPTQVSALESSVLDNAVPVLAVEPEEYVHALEFKIDDDNGEDAGETFLTPAGASYLRGYQDAVAAMIAGLTGGSPADLEFEAGVAAAYADTANLTWGLQATRASTSGCDGRGIRVAVLDTGFDLAHPDFAGRSPITASFVPGQVVQDGHGHGTHCIGTACGPRAPAGTARRYGVATGATIMAGKVLSNAGSGMDSWILAGINWAIQNRAVVISMSLGARVPVGGTFKQAYEQAAQAALNSGALIVAAAGNEGRVPVGSPANCPSIMAVAAVDANLQRASFSCIGLNANGGEVNVAGPGVAVYSSTRMPARYATWNGTSMATPHVAGCAALWAQNTGLRAKPLWNRLINGARNIGLPTQHAGAGLVQAPLCPRIVSPPPRIRWPIRR